MITKEELLAALEDSSRTLELNNQIFGLALKGLESESTVKRLIQARDQWRKKHDDLADELDDKIIALEDKLKAKDADLAVASKIINDAQAKHRNLEEGLHQAKHVSGLEDAQRKGVVDSLRHELMLKSAKYDQLRREHQIQTDHLRNGRLQAENQIGVLEDKLRDTVSLKYHYEIVDSANRQIISLRNKRDAFQRSVSEMHAENNCMRADLENMCKELSVLKIENKKWEKKLKDKDDDWILSVSYYMNLAAAWEKQAKGLKAKLKKFEDFFAGED